MNLKVLFFTLLVNFVLCIPLQFHRGRISARSDSSLQMVNFDACAAASADRVYTTFDNAVACMDSILFFEQDRIEVLDTIRSLLQLYVFVDIQVNYTDGPISTKIDMYKRLAEISIKPYANERAFHDDLFHLFTSL